MKVINVQPALLHRYPYEGCRCTFGHRQSAQRSTPIKTVGIALGDQLSLIAHQYRQQRVT